MLGSMELIGGNRAGNHARFLLMVQEDGHPVLNIIGGPAHVYLHNGFKVLIPVIERFVGITGEIFPPRIIIPEYSFFHECIGIGQFLPHLNQFRVTADFLPQFLSFAYKPEAQGDSN